MVKLEPVERNTSLKVPARKSVKPRIPGCRIAARTLGVLVMLKIGCAVYGADTSLYEVLKGMKYTQSDANLPTLNGTNGFPFQAEVYPMNQGTVTNAFIKVPGSNLWTQLTLTSSQSRFEFKKSKNTLTALNNSYPNGAYQFQIYGVQDGDVGPNLSLLSDAYPAAPHLNNYAALQAVNPNGYSVIRWDAFSSGTRGDFERVTIQDPSGNQPLQSPNMDKQSALNGLATFALVGPGILTTGQSYTVTLDFYKNVMVDRTSDPGAVGAAAYFAETKLPLLTTATAAPDTAVLEVSKGTRWLQTSSAAAAPDASGPYTLRTSVQGNQPNLVSNGTISFPPNTNAPSRTLALQPDLVTLAFSDTASTPGALDGSYASGNYSLSFSTAHDGSKAITIPLNSVTNAPPPPHLANFDSLQQVNAAQSFTVAWDQWTTGGAEDFIQLQIVDSAENIVYSTSNLGQAKAFNAGATNATVSAQTLVPGQVYRCALLFKRLAFVDTAVYPAVLSLGDYYSQTEFTINTRPADVASYSVVKGQLFSQTSTGAAVALPTNGYVFSATVTATASNSVLSASITTPLASLKTLAAHPGTVSWAFAENQSSQSALDASYPYGNYTCQINCAHDGLKSPVLALPAAPYPNPPHVTNYDAAQVINASADFVLGWDSFSGTALNGFIQLTIADGSGNTVFETPAYGLPNALNGLASLATIPAGTLTPNHAYVGTILFEALETIDTTTYPGAIGVSALSTAIQFTLNTAPIGGAPVLSIAVSNSSEVRIIANVVPQQTYRLDGSSILPGRWAPLATNTAASSSLIFLDGIPPGRPQFFYRLVLLP